MNINDFPKSKEKLKGFVKQTLLKFQEVSSEAAKEAFIPEVTEEMVDQYIQVILLLQSRNLYDFFDMNKLYITIDYVYQEGFMANIVGTEFSSKKYDYRVGAEKEVFEEAFKILEETL